MTDKPSQTCVEEWARAVGIELPPATVLGVEANLALLAQLAQILDEIPLDDASDEPAPTFVPR
jgi:hypothetical protein